MIAISSAALAAGVLLFGACAADRDRPSRLWGDDARTVDRAMEPPQRVEPVPGPFDRRHRE